MRATVVMIAVFAGVIPGISTAADGYTVRDSDELYRINLDYGGLSFVAEIDHPVECLTYHPDGYLYGVLGPVGLLVRIDPSTGASTEIGLLGYSIEWPYDLGVDDSGEMWLLDANGLYRVDPATAVATLECGPQAPSVSVTGLTFLNGLSYTVVVWPEVPPVLNCGLTGVSTVVRYLEAGPDGWMYGLWYPPQWQEGTELKRFDPAGGWSTTVGSYFRINLGGLAIPPASSQPGRAVPTLGPGAILLLVFSLSAAGVVVLRSW